jgi:hypothetical protein
MQILHKALEDELGKIPEQMSGQLLIRKLKAQGVKLSRSEHRRIQNHILRRIENAASEALAMVGRGEHCS